MSDCRFVCLDLCLIVGLFVWVCVANGFVLKTCRLKEWNGYLCSSFGTSE